MQGVVFESPRELKLMSFDDPAPGADDAVIAIKASGFCGSDLKFYREGHRQALIGYFGSDPGDAPIIGGHEPCGVIEALGRNVDPNSFRVGDRVAVYHYDGCLYCDPCRTGWAQLCERKRIVFGQTTHGGHAPYLKVPARCLIPLPDELSFAAGAAISCGTGTAYGALMRLDISARDTLAVFGLGPVGQSAILLASAMGARVIAVDVAPGRVAQAKGLGAAEAIDASSTDPVEAIRALTGGKGATLAIDCSTSPAGHKAAVHSTATWGKTALVGLGGEVSLDVLKDMVAKQRTVLGSWTFSSVIMAACVRFVAEHGVKLDQQFTHRWKLEDAVEAYREFDKQTAGKAVFEF